ncbi:MAG: CDP-archaeol synthase [Dehalococcoidia bacterium]|nr:MAG: CDP-archaeol synthase [Dehalococcoidia bacterium]
MIRQRVLSALVLIPIIVVVIWFGGPEGPAYPAFSLLVAAAAALGAVEFYGILGLSRRHPLTIFGLIWVLLFILVAHFEGAYTAPLLTSAVVFSLVWLLLRSPVEGASINWVWTLAGIIYIGFMLSHFIPLRGLEVEGLEVGRDWVLLAVLATFAADTSAFFAGRLWGSHSLAPAISPGKTWEGAIGGFLGAIAASLILIAILPTLSIPYWQVIVLGALIGVFAQLGDLSESMLKRSAAVKDAGKLVPGHGGILDRLDSIVFTVVVVYYYVIWVIM